MRNNDEIIDLLTQLKDEKGFSISEIARRTGMAKSAVSRYFNKSREFPLNRVSEFSNVFGISPEYLLGVENDFPKNLIEVSKKTIKIPVLGTITCGEPILAEQNIEDYREEVEELLPNGELFYLKTKGDSMVPTIPENSYVLIRRQEEVEDGEIAAVIVNGDDEATLKRVKHQGDVVMLFADNSKYAPIIITPDTPARIIGKAVKVSVDL